MPRKLVHGGLVGLGAAAVAILLWFAGVFDRWEYTTWSWRVRYFAQPSAVTQKIKIILLDQASLDWGSEQNGLSWPWPREVYTPIIDFCRRGGARAVAFDVLFTEPSVYGVGDDEVLGTAIGRADDFVGALFLGGESGRSSWPERINALPERCRGLDVWLQHAHADEVLADVAIFPIEQVTSRASLLANVSDKPDPDGIFRRASVFRLFDDHLVPSLGLAAYLAGTSAAQRDDSLELVNGRLLTRAASPLVAPIDGAGRAILRYRGPSGTHQGFSAAAVIQSELRMLAGESPSLSPEVLRDCYVFFGLSAPGLLDLRPTPLSRVYPGVEVHATLLDNLLASDFLRDAPRGLVVLGTLLLALAAGILVVLGKRAWQNLLVFAALLPVPVLVGLAAYPAGLWWPIVVGEGAVTLALVGAVVLNYATEGRQKQFIKQAFKFYLSPQVIEKILADPAQLSLGGERRELTLLFADLQGFTAISESLDPQTLTVLLNDYLSDMTDIVLEEGGTLDKYEGDAFIAFWNAPLPQSDHALRACRAALRCQRRLAARREEFQSRTGQSMRMRIGINTGEVVVGNMGSRQRFNYTILGDAANLASRLEGANKTFGTFTMISATTWQQAQQELLTRELGKLRVVGRQAPVQVFELIGLAGENLPAEFAEFARGLSSYYAGDLQMALEIFTGLSQDPAAKAYAERCRQVGDQPQQQWDGVWVLKEK